MDLLPIDLTRLIREDLNSRQREPDGLLHCSSDLVGSLRHSQLTAAGAPTLPSNIANDVNLLVGTLLHERIAEIMVASGHPFLQEIKLNPYLPTGWSGRCDLIVWNPELKAFVLVDIKSVRGEGMWYIEANGAKDDHIWQVSAYYWALLNAGFPMADRCGVYYLPKYNLRHKALEPVFCEIKPLDLDVIKPVMLDRWAKTEAYLQSLEPHWYDGFDESNMGLLCTNELEPVQGRIQKLSWNAKAGTFDLLLIPHWSAEWCKFPDVLCNCREQGQTKIGAFIPIFANDPLARFDYAVYESTAKGEGIEPEIEPTVKMWQDKL